MQIDKYCKKIKESAIKNECWTCDCLQGFITQLLIDLDKEDVSELKKLLKDKQFLHSCLGCDPCPPGVLFSKYLRKKREKDWHNEHKKELSERDICTQFILPALVKAGWDVEKQIREEAFFTDGRIFVKGNKTARGERKRADL